MAAFPETTTETALTVAEGRAHAVRTPYFVRTHQEQFTYFEGSEAATETTFGMSSEGLMELINAFENEIRALANESSNSHQIMEALMQIRICKTKCKNMLENLNANAPLLTEDQHYRDDYLGVQLHKTGHIPISMSRLATASVYEKATRAVTESDIKMYFNDVPGAKVQGREYLCKNLHMMGAVEALYDFFFAQRYAIKNPHTSEFIFFNNAIARLEEMVIKPNHDSHQQCDRFDLCDTFLKKLEKLCRQIPKQYCDERSYAKAVKAKTQSAPIPHAEIEAFNELFSQLSRTLMSVRHYRGEGTYINQETVSDKFYEHLTTFFNSLGFNAEADGEVELTEMQGQQMDALLPILEYLNSANNPFARSGLYGHVMTNDLHEAALAEYRKHESEQKSSFTTYLKPEEEVGTKTYMPTFTEDQINVLLYGNVEYNEAQTAARTVGGFFSSMGSAVMGLLTESSASGTTRTADTRDEMLALPQPEEYLMLTNIAHNAPAPQE